MKKGTKVRLRSRGALGAVADPGGYRFVASVESGTEGVVGDDAGLRDAAERWYYVEVELEGRTVFVPVTDAFVEPVE